MDRRIVATSCAVSFAAVLGAGVTTYPPMVGSPAYPVPEPVASTLPLEGFRLRASLDTRLSDLALGHDFISRSVIGSTLYGEPIHAFLLTDGDDTSPDGTREGGVMINGTIHAREWASPEIVVQLIEHFAANYGTDPVVSYLVDTHRIVLVPVLNVDGFDQTQIHYNQDDGGRDGRLRRKNMRSTGSDLVDFDLTTAGDRLHGVDLNRNLTVGFMGPGTLTSILNAGPTPFSEPETQALMSAPNLFTGAAQLRFYADVHGAIPALYTVYHGTQAADDATGVLSDRMQATYAAINGVPGSYGEIPVFPGGEIGATDEYHGHTFDIPSFTIEYPTPNYRDGGSGPTFVLPNDEVSGVVEENREAIMLGFLFASGPPILERVRIWLDGNGDDDIQPGEVVYDASWQGGGAGSDSRTFANPTVVSLQTDRSYRVLLQFNKPMRRNVGGEPGNWPGVPVGIQPTVRLREGQNVIATAAALGDGWQSSPETGETPGYARYGYDSWLGTLDLSAVNPVGEAVLAVSVEDLYGHALDENPATVADWIDGWQGFDESSAGDRNHSVEILQASGTEEWRVY